MTTDQPTGDVHTRSRARREAATAFELMRTCACCKQEFSDKRRWVKRCHYCIWHCGSSSVTKYHHRTEGQTP